MLTRRAFLKSSAAALLAAKGNLSGAAEKGAGLKCPPLISGTLWAASPKQSNAWKAAGWRKELEQQRAIGFDLLWLLGAPSLIENAGLSLKDLLDLCAEFKFRVILDTGSAGNWFGQLDLKPELDLCKKNIRRLGERFTGHPAFFGWYIPHEIYMCWGAMNEYIQQLYPALTEACKQASNLPVTVSPFFILDRTKVFGDFRFNEPDEYQRYWSDLIKKSGIDIVMLQDSGEHFSYVTNAQRKPFFEAMSKACQFAGARLWGNVEVADMECPSIEAFVSRYGRVHHSTVKDIPWRAVPLDRLREKLTLAATYSQRIVSWGYREYCRPELGPNAKAWYAAYQSYQKKQR